MKQPKNPDPWEREKVRQVFVTYHETGDPALREELVARYANLVKFIAARFSNRGEPLEDLQQVGFLGLVKAIERFDPNAGSQFTTYATPTIIGEIKRYFRDKSWLLKIPRRLQEVKLAVGRATEALSWQLNRAPTPQEIATFVGVSEADVLEAQELSQAYNLVSLCADSEGDDSGKGGGLADSLGTTDNAFGHVENLMLLKRAFTALSQREQMVTYLRFFKNTTQSEAARILGISQMHVSRLQSKALGKLKAYMTGQGDLPPLPASSPITGHGRATPPEAPGRGTSPEAPGRGTSPLLGQETKEQQRIRQA